MLRSADFRATAHRCGGEQDTLLLLKLLQWQQTCCTVCHGLLPQLRRDTCCNWARSLAKDLRDKALLIKQLLGPSHEHRG